MTAFAPSLVVLAGGVIPTFAVQEPAFAISLRSVGIILMTLGTIGALLAVVLSSGFARLAQRDRWRTSLIERADSLMPSGEESVLEGTVREVAALETRERSRERTQDQIADWVTTATGNVTFVAINVIWVSVWLLLNLPGMPTHFDPFPFSLLAVIIPFEAMILAVFVLMTQSAQARRADRRARLEMQVNILAEREVSKLVSMVAEIHEYLGLRGQFAEEVSEMQSTTRLEHVAEAVEAVEAELGKAPVTDTRPGTEE